MKTALVTGGAARIGAQIAKTLHDNNFKIINDYKLFISNLFSNPSSYYKVSCTDVWLVKKK